MPSIGERIRDLEEAREELLTEAQALSDRDSLTDKEQARWTAIMDEKDGELAKVNRDLEDAYRVASEKKALARTRREANRIRDFRDPDGWNAGSIDDHSGATQAASRSLTFVDHQGNRIRGVAPNETLAGVLGVREPTISIGEQVRQMLTGDIRAEQIGQDDEQGGFLTTPDISTRFVDLARANSVVIRAGAVTIPMSSSELIIARLTQDPTAHWRAELVTVPTTNVKFDRVTLRPRTIAAIIPISVELAEDAPNAAQIIESALAASMGVAIDRACLRGPGNESEPLGVLNTDNLNTVASVGTPTDYSHIIQAVGEILEDNYPGELTGLSWIAHPRDFETYAGLADTTGQPLMPPEWARAPRRLSTTSMPTDQGGGSDSSMLIGDFSEVVVGARTSGIRIRMFETGTAGGVNAVEDLAKFIVAHARVDCAVLRPSFFTALTGVTA